MKNKPLILLHGALGCAGQMADFALALGETFDVHCFDFPGHGGRPGGPPYTIGGFTQSVIEQMDERGIDRADFFGYSMGGYVALDMATSYPSKVGKVITLGTKMEWTPEAADREVRMLDPELIASKVPAFARVLESRHAPGDWKEVVRETAALITRLGKGEELHLNDRSIEAELLICVGDLDRSVSFGEAMRFVQARTGARFQPVPGSEHPLEKVDRTFVVGQIRDFLGS